MANFEKATTRIPTSIGKIIITLGDDGPNKSASYLVEVLDQNGSSLRVRGDTGDLIPYLSQADVNALLALIAKIRAKAAAEFLAP